LKLKEENKIIPSFESIMENDSIIFYELFLLASNIKREVINVLNSFLSFLKKYENKKVHNMIFLMLNPKFKSLRIVSLSIGRVCSQVSYWSQVRTKSLKLRNWGRLGARSQLSALKGVEGRAKVLGLD